MKGCAVEQDCLEVSKELIEVFSGKRSVYSPFGKTDCTAFIKKSVIDLLVTARHDKAATRLLRQKKLVL